MSLIADSVPTGTALSPSLLVCLPFGVIGAGTGDDMMDYLLLCVYL